MNILALDSGTKTGWATWMDMIIQSGMQDFSLRRGESPGMRFLNFHIWLEGMIGKVKPGLIVYERAHHRGGAATEVGVGLTTQIQIIASKNDINYAAVHSGTLKKAILGSGKASKDKMRAAANDFLFAHSQDSQGRTVGSQDEADAVCVLEYALKEWGEI